MIKNWLKNYGHMFLETLPLLGLVFVLNPIMILTSTGLTVDSEANPLLILSALGFCFGAAVSLPLSFFSERIRHGFIAVFRALFMLFFLVTIFYPESGGKLDGSAKQEISNFYYVKLYALYVFCFAIFFYCFIKSFKFTNRLLFIFILISASIAGYWPLNQWWHASVIVDSTDQNYDYSYHTDISYGSEQNIIVILSDMLQGTTLAQYFAMHPTEKKDFEGFTLFSQAVSPFPFTAYGAPTILTGQIYCDTADKAQEKQITQCQESSFITDATEKGFDKLAIGIDVRLDKEQYFYKPQAYKAIAKNWFVLSFQRLLKVGLQIDTAVAPLQWLIKYKEESLKIMKRLTSAPIGKSKNKILFFHSLITHAPSIYKARRYDFHSQHSKEKDFSEVEDYFSELNFSVNSFVDFFNHLKTLGIYDNSLIIITGDHGHFVSRDPLLYLLPHSYDFNGMEKGGWARCAGMYNAAILIKPPLQKGKLKVSEAPMSTKYIRSVIKQHLNNNSIELSNFLKFPKKTEVVFFKNKIKSDPYKSGDDHVILEFGGNVSNLARFLKKNWYLSQCLEYKINTTVSNVNNLNNYLDSAWIKEEIGAWVQMNPSGLSVDLKNVKDKHHKLCLEVSGLVNEKHPQQRLKVLLNDGEIGKILIDRKGKNEVQINIKKGLLKEGLNQFVFEPFDAISPKEIGAWDYPTPISMYLYTFQIKEEAM